MKKLLLIMCMLVSISAYTQAPEKKTLVCDETEVIKSGEKKFRIITTNEEISYKIYNKFKVTILVSYSAYKKHDSRRKDTYWETSYYFENADYTVVMNYIKEEFK
jgi:hypothetical protein